MMDEVLILILDYISEVPPHSERRSGYDDDESLYDHDERESLLNTVDTPAKDCGRTAPRDCSLSDHRLHVIFQAQKRIMRRRRAMIVAAAVACVVTTADWLQSQSRKSYWRRLRAAHSHEARRCRQVQYIRSSLQLEQMDEATCRFWFR